MTSKRSRPVASAATAAPKATRPERSAAPLSVEGILGPDGALARALPGYEHRPQQLALSHAIDRALRERQRLVAEAGTGTGKTLAYLVPAVLSGRKVIVSTATKTLQEQIFAKDLPLLRKQLKLKFEAAYLKGRANYLCAHKFEAFEKEPLFGTPQEAEQWPELRDWAYSTRTGDRAELALPESFSAWPRLTATSDSCLGARCPLYDGCFVTRARREAEGAQVVVVNHHLFFADLALRTRPGHGEAGAGAQEALEFEPGVLPAHDAVIFDEAHALEDAATLHFGVQLSQHRLEELAHDALEVLPPTDGRAGMVASVAMLLRGRAETLFRALGDALGPRRTESSVRLTPDSLSGLGREVDEVLESLGALASVTAGEEEAELAALRRRGQTLAAELEFLHGARSVDHVYWVEHRGRSHALRAAPIDLAHELQQRLYPRVDTVVFTSATLAAAGRFDFFSSRMGLDDFESLAVDSPFDYPTQAALYVPREMPEPNAPDFAAAAAEEIVALTALTGGRAFALFTSLRQMHAVHALCAHRLPYQVLLQGERPKSALLDAFRSEPSVLFASHSFWEGVDVPGDALSLVIIDRLPFASPGDPLVAARIDRVREGGGNPFEEYQLPQAALALRQGFGRLIRTREDRGVVALLDRRVVTKRYGRVFLASLPKVRRVADRELLRRWLQTAVAGPAVGPDGVHAAGE